MLVVVLVGFKVQAGFDSSMAASQLQMQSFAGCIVSALLIRR